MIPSSFGSFSTGVRVLLILAAASSHVQGLCEHDSDKNLCQQCGCQCRETLLCSNGPPTYYDSDQSHYNVYLKGGAGPKFLVSGWMKNFRVKFGDADEWTDEQMWVGKYNYSTKKTTYLDTMKIALEISDLSDLEIITKDFFNPIQRSLVSLEISDCPKLHTIEKRRDYPSYPLPWLNNIVFSNLQMLETLHFLDSEFSNRKSRAVPAPRSVNIQIADNPILRIIHLTKPLSFKGENNVELYIHATSNLATRGILNVCFLKDKVKSISLCGSDCKACGAVWLQAIHDDAENSNYDKTDFNSWGYPWRGSPRLSNSWTFKANLNSCGSKASCRNSDGNSFVDWPVRFQNITQSTRNTFDTNDVQLGIFSSVSQCMYAGQWDPFMVHHECFESKDGWTSCLEGCDCSKETVDCVNGPYYDEEKKRISITKEDLPHLTTLNTRSFDKLPDGAEVETFFIYDNPTLSSIVANTRISPELYREKVYWHSLEDCDITILIFLVVCSYRLFINYESDDNDASGRRRRFNAQLVKNVIVSRSPFLRRMDTFIQKSWTNLEYIEISQLGDSFSRVSSKVVHSIFKDVRPMLVVLDMSYAGMTKFPRIDYASQAPMLRYLLLAGNKFTTVDIETLFPFYSLPEKVQSIPPMLHQRTPTYQTRYRKKKTLDLRENHELVCDCKMALEHLARVQDPLFWHGDQITEVITSDYCKPTQDSSACKVNQDEKTGVVYLGYTDKYVTTDLQAFQDRISKRDLYYTRGDKAYSGMACRLDRAKATYCPANQIAAQDYSYFYCDPLTSTCKPATANDPLIPALECDPTKTGDDDYCYFYQNLELKCPQRIPYGAKCPTRILECNPTLRRCQFAAPFSRSDYKIDLCKFHIGRTLTKSYWDSTDLKLAEKAWVGDCGFRCSAKSDCSYLRRHFNGMNFCCSNKGFCSTNCFESCPPGWTGLLCETNLNTVPLKCPTGWSGPMCSVKLCNKFFLCSNGGRCVQSRCSCTDNFFGPECLTPKICELSPCDDVDQYCESDDGTTSVCASVSRVFAKYKFFDITAARGCTNEQCNATMTGSECLGERCGCPIGMTSLKRIGQPPRCVAGAMPCNVSHQGECSTIHPEMICSGNSEYIGKVALRPVGYVSFCLCALPEYFDTATGACMAQKNTSESAEFLRVFDDVNPALSGAVVAIICLAIVGIGVLIVSVLVLKKRKQDDEDAVKAKREASRASALSTRISASKAAESEM